MNTFKDSSNFENGLSATTINSPTIDAKQDILVSGTSIKTINGEELLGSGDIVIVADSSDKVAKSGDTITGQLNIENNLNIGDGNTFTSTDGAGTVSNGTYAFIQGCDCTASGAYSHAEGNRTTASGAYSHAEGNGCSAIGDFSHTEGIGCLAIGNFSHVQGDGCTASGLYSHAEGNRTTASGEYAFAQGSFCTASGDYSHAEGFYATGIGDYSHAEGYETKSHGIISHAEGSGTIANNYAEHTSGSYNISISGTNQSTRALIIDSQATLFSIGNGASEATRKNAFEVKWNGDIYLNLNGVTVKLQDLLSKIVI